MAFAPRYTETQSARESLRQRLGLLWLTILLHAIVLVVLLLQKGTPLPIRIDQPLTVLALPEGKQETTKQTKAEKQATRKSQPVREESVQIPKAPPPPIVKAPSDYSFPSYFLKLSPDEMAQSDIHKMARAEKAQASADTDGDSKPAYGPGSGPGGATLYAADWYREPTRTELSSYLPARAPRKGWGLIACRTIERFKVDDCRNLGESPAGSGFASAVRQAAWQFQILPPRINGRPIIGAWVSIRIDYTEEDATPG